MTTSQAQSPTVHPSPDAGHLRLVPAGELRQEVFVRFGPRSEFEIPVHAGDALAADQARRVADPDPAGGATGRPQIDR